MSITYSTLHSESCTIHYYSLGSGPQLITFIPGGNGHGKQYFPLMAVLSKTYTCVTFDRRQMSHSVMDGGVAANQKLDMKQQARDVAAVIKAMGFSKSIIFGSSLGGMIGFQLAADYPSIITHLISHEAPTYALLPDHVEVEKYLRSCHAAYLEGGLDAAFKIFKFKALQDPSLPKTAGAELHNHLNFFDNEFMELFDWNAEGVVESVKKNGVSVGLMEGKRSEGTWYARSVNEQRRVLGGEDGCLKWTVPGHHQGFESELETFLPVLKECLKELDERKTLLSEKKEESR